MSRFGLFAAVAVALSGCMNTMQVGTNGQTVSSSSMVQGSGFFRGAVTVLPQDVVPARGLDHVTMHPYARLRSEPACARTISLAFISSYDYGNTLVALRNRALSLGANAVAVTNWTESRDATYMVGHFFGCRSKKNL